MKKLPKKSFNISLLKRFTPFEQKVYKAILKIPRGETKSYQWVAEKIGHPKAARAVGNALNKNPYTIIIPCHRVVRSDGSLGGYSGGLALKNKLLAEEAKT
jgi:methylated-DNA-[protein]-cysteine S-methyltransferase